jgi:hypothetical protein
MKSREERLKICVELAGKLAEANAILKRYPGVRQAVVGLKETGGELTEEIVFRVDVVQKLPPEQLAPDARIPAHVLGVPTDVVVEPSPRLLADDGDKYRPLMGGIQIGNDSGSLVGTLGCLAQLNTDGSIVMLGNHHVMMDGGATHGERIGQPTISCCCCCKRNIVAEVVDSASNALVDCAIARIKGQPGFTNEIHEIGLVLGSVPLNADGSTVLPGDRVFKRGRSTRLTEGLVVAPLSTTPAVPAKSIPARNSQILIRAAAGKPIFSEEGDSGAVVVNEQNQVVGLLWGDAPAGSIANRITDVIAAMNITILNSGTPGTIPLGSMAAAAEFAERDADELATLARELRQSEPGRALLALADRHGREIDALLNGNRQVKVAWHRYQGPAYTAHIIESARDPAYKIPAAIDGIALPHLAIRMSVVLQEHASAALAAAVQQYTLPLLNLIAACDSTRDALQRLGALAGADRAVADAQTA